MQSVIFALDESGAKGYSDNRERFKGELGVAAGILVPLEHVPRVESEIDEIAKRFKKKGKLHIAALNPKEQGSLRNEIFDYLDSVNIRWVYEAIYVEGLYSSSRVFSDLYNKYNKSSRSTIKVSKNEKKELLHSKLLSGAFGKAVAFCIDHVGNEFYLNGITDQMDASIVKLFKGDVRSFMIIGQKRERTVTGFDAATQKVVKGSISTEITEGLDALGDFSGVTYEIAVSNSPLILVADILANSVHHHLISLQSNKPGCRLNTVDSIAGHQLDRLVYGVTGLESDAPQVGDTIFGHPGDT